MSDAGRSKRQWKRKREQDLLKESERVLATSGRLDRGRFCDFFGTCACCPLARASGYCDTRSCPIFGHERYLIYVKREQQVNVVKESIESEDAMKTV